MEVIKNNELTLENLRDKGFLWDWQYTILKEVAPQVNYIFLKGAKKGGKTHASVVDTIVNMVNDQKANAISLRGFKYQSQDKTSRYILSTVQKMKMLGFKMPKFAGYRNHIAQELYSKRSTKGKNSVIMFGSLEDISGTSDGDALPNLGYISNIIIDEPLTSNDTKKNYGEEPEDIERNISNWEQKINGVLYTNAKAMGDFYYQQNKDVKRSLKAYINFNPWNFYAPENQICERIYPEIEFINDFVLNGEYNIEFVLNQKPSYIHKHWPRLKELFYNNYFDYRIDNDSSRAVVFTTRLANRDYRDDKDTLESIFKEIKYALLRGKMKNLTETLGMSSVDEVSDTMFVYRAIKNYNLKTFDDYIKEGYKISGTTWGVDIDTSRFIVVQAGILFLKPLYCEKSKSQIYDAKIHLDQTKIIKCSGSGAKGEKNIIYTKKIHEIVDKMFLKYAGHYISPYRRKINYIYIDDKRKWFIYEALKDKPNYIHDYCAFKQHGQWDIAHRQDKFISLMLLGLMTIEPNNKDLVKTMKLCVKRKLDDPRRDTLSRQVLDFIDAAEQPVLKYYRDIMLQYRLRTKYKL